MDKEQIRRIIQEEIKQALDQHDLFKSVHLHLYLNPERSSHPDAFKVHGLSDEFLADKPRFADVVDQLVAFVEGAELIIHNAPFDIAFLDAEFARIELATPIRMRERCRNNFQVLLKPIFQPPVHNRPLAVSEDRSTVPSIGYFSNTVELAKSAYSTPIPSDHY